MDTVVGEIHVNRTSERHVQSATDFYVTIVRAKYISFWCKQKLKLTYSHREISDGELDIDFDLRLNGSTRS